MNTKNLTVEEAQEQIELLKKQIDFNNRLKKITRKYMREHEIGSSKKDIFNGLWGIPTPEMLSIMRRILIQEEWMPNKLKVRYMEDTASIFGGTWSIAENRDLLKDVKDCERFIELHKVSEDNTEEENEYFSVERNLDTNRMNLYFDYIPDAEIRSILKRNGFRWSPNFECWTRQLTDQAELSLRRIKRELNIID